MASATEGSKEDAFSIYFLHIPKTATTSFLQDCRDLIPGCQVSTQNMPQAQQARAWVGDASLARGQEAAELTTLELKRDPAKELDPRARDMLVQTSEGCFEHAPLRLHDLT